MQHEQSLLDEIISRYAGLPVLVYNNVPSWRSHAPIAYEIVQRLRRAECDVYYFTCNGSLTSCPANAFKAPEKCNECRAISSQDIKKLLRPLQAKIALVSSSSSTVPDFETFEEFAEFTYKELPFGRLALSQLVDDYRSYRFPMDIVNTRGRILIDGAISLFEQSLALLSENAIQCAFFWNGRRPSDGPVHFAAQVLGIPSFAYISGGDEGRFLVVQDLLHDSKNSENRVKDFYDNIGENVDKYLQKGLEYSELTRLGTNTAFGAPTFSRNFKNENIPLPPEGKPRILVCTTTTWESIAFYQKKSMKNHAETFQFLRKLLNNPDILSKYHIMVRWHPHQADTQYNEARDIQDLIHSTSKSVIHFGPESLVNTYDLIRDSDFIITYGSTVGIEATIMGKPSISITEEFLASLSILHYARDFLHLTQLLDSKVPALPPEPAILYLGYQKTLGEPYRNFQYDTDSGFYLYEKYAVAKLNSLKALWLRVRSKFSRN